jgi:hypothetical protein
MNLMSNAVANWLKHSWYCGSALGQAEAAYASRSMALFKLEIFPPDLHLIKQSCANWK